MNDAEKAIMLDPNWPKGYFRKGRALHGLKMYKEAEEAYLKVLDIENPDDPELDEELFKVRSFQLQEMGFSKTQSESAIKNYQTVQASLEALFKNTQQTTSTTTNETDKSNESCSDIDNNEYDYNENDSDYADDFNNNSNNNFNNKKQNTNNGSNKLKTITNGNTIKNSNRSNNSSNNSSNISNGSHNNDYYSNGNSNNNNNNNNENRPNHPVNNGQPSTSLWIGNVDPNVTEDTLIEMFSVYGQLANVRCLPEKYCAFVNFKTKDDAHKALQNLQVIFFFNN